MMHRYRIGARLAAALLIALPLAGCDDLLEVTDPDLVTPEQATGPAAVGVLTAGMIGDFQEAVDNLVLYGSLFTDEMILSGTFPTRILVDERNVLQDPENGSLNSDVFEPLQFAREAADRNRETFRAALSDPAYEEVLDDVQESLALANLYGGFIRLYMAEYYCAAVTEPEGPAITPDSAAEAALARFQEADELAEAAGLSDIAAAAQVGKARALVWLGQYAAAADTAASVPSDFTYFASYSENQLGQYNEVHSLTWAEGGAAARWTVGDGTTATRHNERYAYYDEWLEQGLLLPDPPGIDAPEVGVEMTLQLLYSSGAMPITVASWWEAQMIIAEHELRSGAPEAAETRVNALLADPTLNPMTAVNPGLELDPFDPVNFTGDPATDLPQLARARQAGLWLTGLRQPTLRRFAARDGVDLYPTGTLGDDIYFPIPQQEVERNPNLDESCPI